MAEKQSISFGRGISAKRFEKDTRSQIAYTILMGIANEAKPLIQKVLDDVTATIPHGMHGSHGPGHNGAIDLTANTINLVVTKNDKHEMVLEIDVDLNHKRAQRMPVGNSKWGKPVDLLYAFNNGWTYPYKLYIPESYYHGMPDPYGSHKEAKFTRNYYPGDGFISEAAYRIELLFAYSDAIVRYDPKYTHPKD